MPLTGQARKNYANAFYAANKEKWVARRKAQQTPEGRARLRALRQARPITPAQRATWRRNIAVYRVKNAEKEVAHRTVAAAVRNGGLTKPTACDRCGETPTLTRNGRSQIHGHHYKGYEYPLVVIWLCPVCHKKEHH